MSVLSESWICLLKSENEMREEMFLLCYKQVLFTAVSSCRGGTDSRHTSVFPAGREARESHPQ